MSPGASAPTEAVVPTTATTVPMGPVAADENSGLPEALARKIDLGWAAGVVGGIGALFLLLSLVRGVSVPVMLALALAYALNPVVTALVKRRMPRTRATALVFAGLVVALTGFGLYLIPVFRDEAAKLPDFIRAAGVQLVPWVERTFGISVPTLIRERASQLSDEASDLLKEAGPAAAKLVASFASNTASVVASVLGLLVVPVLAFFFLDDYPVLVERLRNLLPRRALPLLERRFGEVDDVLSAFVRGQLTVGAILSVIYSAGLSIARIDMAIVIGLIAGFGNMVPYLGTGVGASLAVISVLLSWQGPWQFAVVAGTFLLAQLLEGLFITPRVVGTKVGLPPVAVIIAVLAFAELFGFAGVLLAVPATATLKVALKVVLMRYRRTPFYLAPGP